MKFVTCEKHEFDGLDCYNVTHLGDVSTSIAHGLNCYIENTCFCLLDAPKNVTKILTSLYSLGPYMYPMEIEFSILVGKLDINYLFLLQLLS